MSEEKCDDCGDEFLNIALHWSQSDCNYPKLSEYQSQMIDGLMMGDASISRSLTRSDRSYGIQVEMINPWFLYFVDEKLGIFSNGVALTRTSEELKKQNIDRNFSNVTEDSEYHNAYKLVTKHLPTFDEYGDWYSEGQKRFPDDIELTPIVAKFWYCSDGTLSWDDGRYPQIQFSSSLESDRPEFIEALFEDAGWDAHMSNHVVYLPTDETEDFLSWMGSSPRGFEYKWESKCNIAYHSWKETSST